MTIADQIAAEVLSTALEGGIGYWSLATEIVYDETTEDTAYLSVKLHEYEEDDEKRDAEDCIIQQTFYGNNYYQTEGHTVTRDALKRAISEIAFAQNGSIKYMNDNTYQVCVDLIFNHDNVDYDSDDADQIIQYAIFGEVVYG